MLLIMNSFLENVQIMFDSIESLGGDISGYTSP